VTPMAWPRTAVGTVANPNPYAHRFWPTACAMEGSQRQPQQVRGGRRRSAGWVCWRGNTSLGGWTTGGSPPPNRPIVNPVARRLAWGSSSAWFDLGAGDEPAAREIPWTAIMLPASRERAGLTRFAQSPGFVPRSAVDPLARVALGQLDQRVPSLASRFAVRFRKDQKKQSAPSP